MPTYREVYFDRIDRAKTVDDVKQAWAEILEQCEKDGVPESTARHNLGYILGYFGDETQKLWYGALPDVSHPIFGPSFGRGGNPTPEEAFNAGVEFAKNIGKE